MKVTLEVTFRMGGVDFRGHRWDGDTLVFEFERRGDAYIQVLSDRKVEVDVEKRPKKVVVELHTKEGTKTYEAFERDGVYMAAEL
ncbi:hypothetical protein [Thermococcus stetteri]|uniref:hypothetical protein n=1 Tax=Thermococcus stetteri TaxID=49900 RepID=UPI001AE8FCA2|nr:hypothetical protein [Thermococcus stetteri]MBP1911759.1 hypothetical protein [Thermococcus stetteri]